MMSSCIFCATPCSSEAGGFTVEDHLKVGFILRNILGIEKDKVGKLVGGKFENQLYCESLPIQVCGSCEAEVEVCYEAEVEIVRLRNKATRLSTGLKERIYETKQEEGDGMNSIWGKIRLDSLLSVVANERVHHHHRLTTEHLDIIQTNVDATQLESNRSTSAAVGVVAGGDEGEANQDSCQSQGANADSFNLAGHDQDFEANFIDGDGGVTFGDPMFEVEEKCLILTSNTEENKDQEELCSMYSTTPTRSSSGLHVQTQSGSLESTSRSSRLETTTSSEDESNSKDDNKGKQVSSINPEKLRRQPDGLYHCPLCSKKYVCIRSRNNHKETHSPKYVCKFCHRSYVYAKSFRDHIKKICERAVVPKRPCKYCGKEFPNRKAHQKVCGKRECQDLTWKQYLK